MVQIAMPMRRRERGTSRRGGSLAGLPDARRHEVSPPASTSGTPSSVAIERWRNGPPESDWSESDSGLRNASSAYARPEARPRLLLRGPTEGGVIGIRCCILPTLIERVIPEAIAPEVDA
eukprot:809082-Pleurochrysis_carterae.AAC.4